MRKCSIQLAFNDSVSEIARVVPYLSSYKHIIIEAGTPLLKKEGMGAIREIRRYWRGQICADLKINDGAEGEVLMAKEAGATSVTAMGNSSKETLQIFVDSCKKLGIISVIDMMNNPNPLKTLWKSNVTPDVVFIHRGRDEENAFGKILQYKDVAKIKGKWNIEVGAAGGIDEKELQSAIFNSADIVVVNIVQPGSPWKGIVFDENFNTSLQQFLRFVE